MILEKERGRWKEQEEGIPVELLLCGCNVHKQKDNAGKVWVEYLEPGGAR